MGTDFDLKLKPTDKNRDPAPGPTNMGGDPASLSRLIQLANSREAADRARAVPALARTATEALILPPPEGDARWRSAWGAQIAHYLPTFIWNQRRAAWISPSLDDIPIAHFVLTIIIGWTPPCSDGVAVYINEREAYQPELL